MNNNIRHLGSCISMMLCLLVASFVSSGCNDDGDETISLEFGNIRSMILGRWYSGGVCWTFYDTYYTRSDMGTRQLTWHLGDSYNQSHPYFGNIYLSGSTYDIISMGGGFWVIRDTKGGEIEFTRDENGGMGNDTPVVPVESGSSNMVKRIEIQQNNNTLFSVDFEYDNKQLVSKAIFTGNRINTWPCSPEGSTFYYTASNGGLKVTYVEGGRSWDVASAKLDSQNHITELYDGYGSPTYYYTHNSKGQCTQWSYHDNRPYTYTWIDDCIKAISGNPGGTSHGTNHSTTENKANLNLNWMLDDQIFDEDEFGLTLCGYISAKEKYLKEGKWMLYSNGCPKSIMYGKYTYYIYYY